MLFAHQRLSARLAAHSLARAIAITFWIIAVAAAGLCLLAFFSGEASARTHRVRHNQLTPTASADQVSRAGARHLGSRIARRDGELLGRRATSLAASATVVGGRPAECFKFPETRRLFCGCASALEVGLNNADGHWNLAANWFALPRTEPAANKAVVRHGHVAILKYHLGGSVWMAYDPNSGHGLTRIQPIDIRHFSAVVDPSGNPSRPGPHRRRYASREP